MVTHETGPAGRYRLRSLFEMLTFYAVLFTSHMVALRAAADEIEAAQTDLDLAGQRLKLQWTLKNMQADLQKMPLVPATRMQFDGLMELTGKADKAELAILLRVFYHSILTELNSAWFLMIPEAQRELYEQNDAPFGSLIETVFPDARYDIAAASRCLALDEWTASVFHLMRVVEHGLRDMANRLKIPMAATVDQENWGEHHRPDRERDWAAGKVAKERSGEARPSGTAILFISGKQLSALQECLAQHRVSCSMGE